MHDDLGDRMKGYERAETSRSLDKTLPVYARIDGRGFSKFTRGLDRPFDRELSQVMQDTLYDLMDETHALAGFTQSDEISLLWHLDLESNPGAELMFGGKIEKLSSVLAGLATASFMANWQKTVENDEKRHKYAQKRPHFDTRIFNLPNASEAVNSFVWRYKDCTRNAVSMAARNDFSHNALFGKTVTDMRAMMEEKGTDYDALPEFFRYGTFAVRTKIPVSDRNGGYVHRNKIALVSLDFDDMPFEQKLRYLYGDQADRHTRDEDAVFLL